MGRWVNTSLGQRWSDESHPDEPTNLRYSRGCLQALGRIDGKLDHAVAMGKEVGAVAASTPPKPTVDPRITTLARAMGDKDYHLPTGAIASLTFDENDEIIATGLTIEGRFWSIESIIKLGLINERGAWLWHRYSAINMALPPVNADHLRPYYQATVAGRTYERGSALG